MFDKEGKTNITLLKTDKSFLLNYVVHTYSILVTKIVLLVAIAAQETVVSVSPSVRGIDQKD